MAVDLTYARTHVHDRAYFAEPQKLLGGKVAPPSFNLRNPLMVRKHVHATALTVLEGIARDSSVLESEQHHVRRTLDTCFPKQIRSYLFDAAGHVPRARIRPIRIGCTDCPLSGLLIRKRWASLR